MEGSRINPILTIEYICNSKENQFFDRKSTKKDVKEIAEHISAFANASGGVLVIGVSNDGKIEGFEDYGEEKFNKFLKSTSIDYLKTVPNYRNEILEVINCKGNKDKILLIHIEPSTNTLIRTTKDEVYLRQGDSSNKLSFEQVKILEYDRREVTFEEQLNMRTTLEDIDMDMLEIYKKAVGADKTEPLELLRARGFLIKTENGEHLNNAGTLLFTKDPSKFFVTARVRVVKFEGDKMKTGSNLNVIKDKTFSLPLYKAIKETVAFVDTQLREFSFLGDDGHFVTVSEYPKFAWEERNYKCNYS